MRLEKASYKAVKYACMNFHYAKSVPVNTFGYSVFNDKNEWCGVVLFGLGANNNAAKQYNLKQGQVIELVRMALNGKHHKTSRVLSISIKLIKKDLPLIRLIISYADGNQNHLGTIYQATNWYYTGDSQTTKTPAINGKRIHAKSIYSKYGTNSISELQSNGVDIKYLKDKPKRKYIYPLDKSLIPLCKSLSKPYPKKDAHEVNEDKRPDSIGEIGGSNPTHALHI
jgi:hypothetical protein